MTHHPNLISTKLKNSSNQHSNPQSHHTHSTQKMHFKNPPTVEIPTPIPIYVAQTQTQTSTQSPARSQSPMKTHEPRSSSSCAACKFLKRRCVPTCLFAPYFRSDEPTKFARVHKVFGASNVSKILIEVPEEQRQDTVNSLAYEAEARLKDPVYGCIGAIATLQKKMVELQHDLALARARLARYSVSGSVSSSNSSGSVLGFGCVNDVVGSLGGGGFGPVACGGVDKVGFMGQSSADLGQHGTVGIVGYNGTGQSAPYIL